MLSLDNKKIGVKYNENTTDSVFGDFTQIGIKTTNDLSQLKSDCSRIKFVPIRPCFMLF